MRVLIGFETASLGEVLGVGGEATVYRHGDRAVKVFHDTSMLDAKVRKLGAFPRGLPPEVVAPEELALDAKTHRPVGYVMPAVRGARVVGELMRKSFRAGAVPSSEVCALFARIHDVLSLLHSRRVIAGDLNDGNLLFAGRRPWFIDVDSMQLPGHPCTVAHERYLDPELYGVDLSARCCFTEETDWYAFSVLLFTALLFVHPYGGVHPDHPTLLRRAQNRVSVLDPRVKYPKSAEDWRTLPDGLLDEFRSIFDRGERRVFPRALLDLPWGVRSAVRATAQATRVNRTCRAIRIFHTSGRILAAAMTPSLAYVYEEAGVARREDGSTVSAKSAVARFTAERFFERDGWLWEADRRTGRVLEGQTFLRAGRSLGFGFYRAGLALFSFLVRPGSAGLINVELPPIAGRLISADAVFDDRHALVSFLFDRGGVRCGAMYLVREDGAVIGHLEGAIESERVLASTSGRAVQGGLILAATEEGLVLLAPDPSTGRITARKIFTDTEPFVEEGAQILPGPNGSVYVVTTDEIKQLVLS
jgi:hypothetical protein